jgi:hydrogenase maturation factor HypF (carbamoyltransferase family)
MVEAVRRLSCIHVCETCVKRGEEVVSRRFFGDFGLCERCRDVMTSKNTAYWVRP